MTTALALPASTTSPVGAVSISGAPRHLPRRAKAAIIVRYLLSLGADIALEDLPEDLQTTLTQQLGAIRLVDKQTLEAVIEEFTTELEAVGLALPGDLAGALTVLDGKISPHTAARLRKEAGVRQTGDPWARLSSVDADKLAKVLEDESIEIAAVVLSKLQVDRAAEIMGKLPGPLARRVAYAVSQTNAVTPEAVDRIGQALATQLDAEPVPAFEDGPVKRVGAILNSTVSATRDDVLNGLDETDKPFADEVRKAIFTFANIPARVSPRDIPTVLRQVDQEAIVTAFAAAEPAGHASVVEFIFANMSARLADQLREEIGERGKVKPAEGEEAMSQIVAAIRRLEAAGDIILVTPSEDDEDDI